MRIIIQIGTVYAYQQGSETDITNTRNLPVFLFAASAKHNKINTKNLPVFLGAVHESGDAFS